MQWGLIVVVIMFIVMLLWMLSQAFRTRVETQEVWLDRLPAGFDGTRLFFISDIHRRVIPDELIEKCKAAGGADLVLIGGDMTEKGVPLERTRSNICKLGTIAPVYAIYGNHDYDIDMRVLDVLLREEGVKLLVNEHVVLEQRDGSVILLCGVDDPILERDSLQSALECDRNPLNEAGTETPFTLLLSHDPMIANRLEGQTIDLILSGHTHGGQIAMPLLGPIFRKKSILTFCAGWYDLPQDRTTGYSGTRLFVSRGFGTSKLPLRSFAPAESHLFILRSPKAAALSQSPLDR
ncbi:metallophosphoesterase [Paenibacillus tarimensis]